MSAGGGGSYAAWALGGPCALTNGGSVSLPTYFSFLECGAHPATTHFKRKSKAAIYHTLQFLTIKRTRMYVCKFACDPSMSYFKTVYSSRLAICSELQTHLLCIALDCKLVQRNIFVTYHTFRAWCSRHAIKLHKELSF